MLIRRNMAFLVLANEGKEKAPKVIHQGGGG